MILQYFNDTDKPYLRNLRELRVLRGKILLLYFLYCNLLLF